MNGGPFAHALVLVALLMLALPSLSAHNLLENRGFRVPAHRKAVQNTIAKRSAGGGLVSYSNVDGWFVSALISGQEVTMTVDCGSADFWVASTLLPPSIQRKVTTGKIFNPNTSSTFRTKSGYSFDIHYGDGSGASGPVGIDEIGIGEAVVPKMPFGVVNKWEGSFGTSPRSTSGIFGLAFGSINTMKPETQCTFMECLQHSLPEPVFTTSLSLEGDSFLDFGFIDEEAYTGNFTKIPIDNSIVFWQAKNLQFGASGKTLSSDDSPAVLDTGTTFLYLAQSTVSDYTDLIEGAKYDNATALYLYPCGSQLPDLTVTFTQASSGPRTVVISGDHLQYARYNSSSPDCVLRMGSSTGLGMSLLGQPFFADRYVVFNQSEPSMSFANATGKGTIKPPANTIPNATTNGASQASTGSRGQETSAASAATGTASSLSTGAQAGIGVGAAIAGLLLIAFGIWIFRRHKKGSPSSQATVAEDDYSGKPELGGQGVQRSELHGKAISEMAEKPPELSSDVRHELPGDEFAREMPSTARAEPPS